MLIMPIDMISLDSFWGAKTEEMRRDLFRQGQFRAAGAYAAWFGALRAAFCWASLRRPSTTSAAIWSAARRLARVSTSSDSTVGILRDSAGLVLRVEEFIEVLPYFSVVLWRSQINIAKPRHVSRVVHEAELEARVF